MSRAVPIAALILCAGCGGQSAPQTAVAGGDASRGREFIGRYGCGACHVIPGIAAARGLVGPPLDAIGRRAYLGGILPNTPDTMVTWIRHPQRIDPRTAMPDLGVSEPEAKDIAAYLYTLK